MSTENTTFSTLGNDRLTKAREAAKLKRERKAKSILAMQKGKEEARLRREKVSDELALMWDQERADLEKKIQKARKALYVRKNESDPPGLTRHIEHWKMDILLRMMMLKK